VLFERKDLDDPKAGQPIWKTISYY